MFFYKFAKQEQNCIKMSQLEKVGLLVYTAIKSGMLSPGKEYDFDFTMSSWNQKLGRQSLPTKALWDTDLGVQS